MLSMVRHGFARLATASAIFGGVLLVIAALTVTLEVILRKLVSPILGPQYNMTGSDEIAAYLFAVATSMSLAAVVVHRGNVRIDAIYRLFGPRSRAALDVLALITLLAFAVVLLERGWSVASVSASGWIVSNTTLRVPLAIPQIAWVFGLAMFVAAIVLSLVTTVAAILRGDLADAAAISGAITAQEEVSGELQGLGIETPSRHHPRGEH